MHIRRTEQGPCPCCSYDSDTMTDYIEQLLRGHVHTPCPCGCASWGGRASRCPRPATPRPRARLLPPLRLPAPRHLLRGGNHFIQLNSIQLDHSNDLSSAFSWCGALGGVSQQTYWTLCCRRVTPAPAAGAAAAPGVAADAAAAVGVLPGGAALPLRLGSADAMASAAASRPQCR